MSHSRRTFIGALGALGAAKLAPALAADVSPPAADPAGAGAPAAPYLFFSPAEAAWVEAAVDRLVPTDELGPGGTDLGLARFIDGQLAGPFGQGDKMYMEGPWLPGTPQQGWQLPMTPAGCYRAAIPRVDLYCGTAHGGPFHRLAAADQDAVLRSLESGEVDLVELPGHVFFKLLHQNAMEGLFSDPLYGGNRDKLGWKLVGFPGARGNYVDVIEQYRNKPYQVEVAGIADQ